jgi:hypothetical protein
MKGRSGHFTCVRRRLEWKSNETKRIDDSDDYRCCNRSRGGDWFHVHKGEVALKAQIVVWGQLYRIDVWQRVWLGGRIEKTWSSRVTEKGIQEQIEQRR